MREPPYTSESILSLSLNLDDGTIEIENVPMRPVGVGSDYLDVARDDAKAVFSALTDLRNEVFAWRHYAAKIRDVVASLPLADGSKPCFDVDRLTQERDEAIRRAIRAEQRVRDTLCEEERLGRSPCGECQRCLLHLKLTALESDGE